MADPLPPIERRPRRRGTSIALICIGLLILVPSGLCTTFFGVAPVIHGAGGSLIGIALLLGGPPIVIGIALIWWGLTRDRR